MNISMLANVPVKGSGGKDMTVVLNDITVCRHTYILTLREHASTEQERGGTSWKTQIEPSSDGPRTVLLKGHII